MFRDRYSLVASIKALWMWGMVVAVASVVPCPGQTPFVAPGGVLNAADYTRDLAPGMIVSIFGSELAPRILAASSVPLPNELAGVSVEILQGGSLWPAPLFFVSPGQINAQLPFALAEGEAGLRVATPSGVSSERPISISAAAPRLFTTTMDGAGTAIALHADYSVVSDSNPAKAGEYLILYLTGLGAVSPSIPAGAAGGDNAANGPINYLDAEVEVRMGDRPASVVFAGLAPGFAGLYQVNFQTPPLLEGSVPIEVSLGEDSASQWGVSLPSALDWRTLSETNVGPSGGTIEAGDLQIAVPPGAFESTVAVTVANGESGRPDSLDGSGTVYRIAGLPADAGPIEASFPVSSDAVEEPFYVWSALGDDQTGGWLIPAHIAGGRVVAMLTPSSVGPSASPLALTEAPFAAPAPLPGFRYIFYTDIRSSEGAYWTVYFSPKRDTPNRLRDYLDEDFSRIEQLGFSLPRPMAVHLDWRWKPSSLESRAASWRYYPQPRSGGAYVSTLDGTHEIALRHAAMHLILERNDPNTFGREPVSWIWMDEAVAHVLGHDVCSAWPLENYLFAFERGLEFPGVVEEPGTSLIRRAQQHGYGAALFAAYLQKQRFGDYEDWMYDLQAYRNATDASGDRSYLPTEALAAMGVDLSAQWLGVAKSYIGEELGCAPEGFSADVVTRSAERTARLSGAGPTSAVLEAMRPDLSLEVGQVQFGDELPGGNLVVTAAGGAVLLHRIESDGTIGGLLATVTDRFEMDPSGLSGTRLLVTLVNDRPGVGSKSVSATFEFMKSLANSITAQYSVPFECVLPNQLDDDGKPRTTPRCTTSAGLVISTDVHRNAEPASVAWDGGQFQVSHDATVTVLGSPIQYQLEMNGILSDDRLTLEWAEFKLRVTQEQGTGEPVVRREEFTVWNLPIEPVYQDEGPPEPGLQFSYQLTKEQFMEEPEAHVTDVYFGFDYVDDKNDIVGSPKAGQEAAIPLKVTFRP